MNEADGVNEADGSNLVSVRNLHVTFDRGGGTIPAVRGVDLDIRRGECLAVVGESGSGKSVTARTLIGLAGPGAVVRADRFEVDGRDARRYGEPDWRRLRGGFAGLVLQDALVSLDPLRTVGAEIAEFLRLHRVPGRADRVRQLLDLVHLPEPERRARQYPHELSGGLRQRALIASAIAGEPELLIADEPTTALDVSVQAQILRLLDERRSAGATLLLISHDLGVVAQVADRVLVMRAGRVVESGTVPEVVEQARHSYTRQLLAAVPSAASRGRRLSGVGTVAPRPDPGPVVVDATALRRRYGRHTVVRDVDLTIRRGEIVGLVGESGSGKSTIGQLLFGTLAPTSGTVTFEGIRWSGVAERRRRPLRRRMQLISQDPLGSFDPRYPVGRIVAEAMPDRGDVVPLLERVGLSADLVHRFPRDLSGGQRQRVAIARALAPRPSLLICDEPVSALDVSVQAQVLDLLADIRATDGTAMLFISHDIGVVHHLCDRVVVLHDGAVVEHGPVDDVFHRPVHDHTRVLVAAVPTLPVG